MPLSPGQILQQRYRILRPLGQGGMGAVYLAEHTQLSGRRFAIKENIPDPAASQQALAQRRQQFLMEAQVLATLDHQHLPKVSDYFTEGGNEYLVMDFVEGQNLEKALEQHMQQQGKPLPEKPVLIWAGQVLEALEYLHAQRPHPVIHRDIKPANIILTPQGKAKLVDFGLVKLYDPVRPDTATVIQGMGTPEYTPLEQYPGSTIRTNERSDVYALGATLYHLLTGIAPPVATDRLLDPTKLQPPRQLNPALSAATEAALLKALGIRPDQRFQSAGEMRQALIAGAPLLAPPALVSGAPTHPASPSSGARHWLLRLGLGAVALVLLTVFAYGLGSRFGRGQPEATPTPAVAAMSASVPTETPAAATAPAVIGSPSPEPTLIATPMNTATRAPTSTLAVTATPVIQQAPVAAADRTATAAFATAEAFRLRTATPTATLTPTPDATATAAFEVSGRIATAEALGLDPDSIRTEKDGMELAYVPAGDFLMGSAESDSDAQSDERPQHRVFLDAFWIDRTEVTNAMFTRFVEESGYQTEAESGGCGWVYQAGGSEWKCIEGATWQHPQRHASELSGLEQHPVVQVSWNDARAYCEWADRRLPTEAEWEKAARGTDGRVYAWGSVFDGNNLNFCDRNCPLSVGRDVGVDDGYIFTASVGSYPAGASPYGVLDMAGNVWEWTGDWYNATYYGISPTRNPTGPAVGQYRVLRGGSWNNTPNVLRGAFRYWITSDARYVSTGFRCARSP